MRVCQCPVAIHARASSPDALCAATNTYYQQVKNNKNKWQSIKHVTSNKYTQSHMHYAGLFDIENAIPPL